MKLSLCVERWRVRRVSLKLHDIVKHLASDQGLQDLWSLLWGIYNNSSDREKREIIKAVKRVKVLLEAFLERVEGGSSG
jgi:hypothetical protein